MMSGLKGDGSREMFLDEIKTPQTHRKWVLYRDGSEFTASPWRET